MVAIKDMEIPKNCVECNHMDLQQAINCQLIYSGCANCGRHPNCPLVEIGTCKDCKHWEYNENKSFVNGYCASLEKETGENFYCKDFEKRGSRMIGKCKECENYGYNPNCGGYCFKFDYHPDPSSVHECCEKEGEMRGSKNE